MLQSWNLTQLTKEFSNAWKLWDLWDMFSNMILLLLECTVADLIKFLLTIEFSKLHKFWNQKNHFYKVINFFMFSCWRITGVKTSESTHTVYHYLYN